VTFIVTTSAKGQVVIPTAIRKLIALEPGQKVSVELRDGQIILKPLPADAVAALTGLCKGESSLTQALLQERKEAQAHEAEKFARFLRDADATESGAGLRKDTGLS